MAQLYSTNNKSSHMGASQMSGVEPTSAQVPPPCKCGHVYICFTAASHRHWGLAARCGCLLVGASGLRLRACLGLLVGTAPTSDASLAPLWAAAAAAAAACLLVITPAASSGTRVPNFAAAAAAAAAPVEALWKAGWHAGGVDVLVSGAALARVGGSCTAVTLTAGLVGRAIDQEGRLLWLPLRDDLPVAEEPIEPLE